MCFLVSIIGLGGAEIKYYINFEEFLKWVKSCQNIYFLIDFFVLRYCIKTASPGDQAIEYAVCFSEKKLI